MADPSPRTYRGVDPPTPPETPLRALLLVPVLTACVTEAECQRREDVAWRVALEDADACVYDAEGLDQPECAALDLRPTRSYASAWCGTASLSCICADTTTAAVCFATPDDDGSATCAALER